MRFLAQMCQTRTFNLYLVDRLRTSNDSAATPCLWPLPLPPSPLIPPSALSPIPPSGRAQHVCHASEKTKKLKTKNKIKQNRVNRLNIQCCCQFVSYSHCTAHSSTNHSLSSLFSRTLFPICPTVIDNGAGRRSQL